VLFYFLTRRRPLDFELRRNLKPTAQHSIKYPDIRQRVFGNLIGLLRIVVIVLTKLFVARLLLRHQFIESAYLITSFFILSGKLICPILYLPGCNVFSFSFSTDYHQVSIFVGDTGVTSARVGIQSTSNFDSLPYSRKIIAELLN
jgi:hypothetical protein